MATLEQRLYDGSRAREVLDNEVFKQVFADIEQELFTAWTESPQRDEEGREKLHQYLVMLRRVKQHLQTTMETGKLAELELNHQRSVVDRIKEVWR